MEDMFSVNNPYTSLYDQYHHMSFPSRDETAILSVLDPSIVTNSTTSECFVPSNSTYADGCSVSHIKTSYASSAYGKPVVYQEALKPPRQDLQKIIYPFAVGGDRVKAAVKHALQNPKSCADL